MALELEQLTCSVIGAAIDVHRELGPGFIESVYERALVVELERRGIPFQRQWNVPLSYKGVEIGAHRLDLFVAGQLVVELKATRSIANEHFAVVRSYIRAVGRKHGLILNFSGVTLDAKRVLMA